MEPRTKKLSRPWSDRQNTSRGCRERRQGVMALSLKEFNAWLVRCGTQVEVTEAKHYDDERALISPSDYQGLFLHDVKVGILKGTYRFGKGLVTGVADLGILA